MRSALSGLSVLEIGRGTAVEYCSKLFADLGADVVKVETETTSGRQRDGAYSHLNTNKRSVVADPSDPDGRQVVRSLAAVADLVVESHDGPDRSDLSAWGLDRDELQGQAPALTVAHLSGFGTTGPYAGYRSADIAVQAMANSMCRGLAKHRIPVRLPGESAQCFVGHVAALGALAAVTAAEHGGRGSFVDSAELEVLSTIPMRQANLLGYQYRQGRALPVAVTAAVETLIPTGVFPCADGYLSLMSTTQQLQEMLSVLDDDAAKEAFAHPQAFDRPETKEALDVALYSWLLSHTRAEATAEAQAAGWPMAGVMSIPEVLEADHLHQRNFWVHADDPDHGSLAMPGPWCRFGEGGWALRRLAPEPGQDTASIRRDPRSLRGPRLGPRLLGLPLLLLRSTESGSWI